MQEIGGQQFLAHGVCDETSQILPGAGRKMSRLRRHITLRNGGKEMSAKTKIVVLHMKELIYTLIFVGLGILLVVLLLFMFLPRGEKEETVPTMNYVAGVYTSSVMLDGRTVDVQVIVDESRIQSVSMVNLDEAVATMYPLMEPALEDIAEQVVKNQSTEGITYQAENQYTSVVLLNAIENALAKARILEGEAEE